MTITQWLLYILIGGLMGAIGQGVRSTVGLKKLRDVSGDSGSQFSQNFSPSRYFSSIFVGFLAGALTVFFMVDETEGLTINRQLLLSFMVAGYAGTDLIEGFANKIVPGSKPAG